MASLATAWDASDLVFTAATFTETQASGYGQYTPLASAEFSDGQPLNVYAEPVGYSFNKTDEGLSYKVTASYRLLNTTGQVLAAGEDIASFSGVARSPKRELPASLTFQFGGLPAGEYTLETTFTDGVGGKSGTFSLPFNIRASQ